MSAPGFVRPAVYELPPYRALGGERPSVRLDGNENPLGPPPEAVEVLRAAAPETLSRYPGTEGLRRTWAERLGVATEELLLTAGSGPALALAADLVLEPGDVALLAEPSFELYAWAARRRGASVRAIPCGPHFAFPTRGFRRALERGRPTPRLAIIGFPDNPTGRAPAVETVERLARAFGDTLFVIDEAYAEFTGMTVLPLVRDLPNVLVTRTLSKAHGLAGVRVGAAIGAPALIEWLARLNVPYPLTGPAVAMALAALEAEEHVRRTVCTCRRSVRRLHRELTEAGLTVRRTGANFVLVHLGSGVRAGAVTEALARRGVAVRDRSRLPQMAGWVRVSAGTRQDTDRVLDELRLLTAPPPEALLFDMDGVLVDVRASYDEALFRTVCSFLPPDARPSRAAVLGVKNRPDANDDVDAACLALAAADARVPRAAVARRFQEFYLGTNGRSGLATRERWLLSPAEIDGLARRLPLGIVTGRPRAEALAGLERGGMDRHFRVVVTPDDVTAKKPDPAPVCRAVAELGVRTAWFLGDSPADLLAGRRADLPTVAVVSEASARGGVAARRRSLRRYGPLAVLGETRDIGDVLAARAHMADLLGEGRIDA